MENYYFLGTQQQPVGPMPLATIKDLHSAGMIHDDSMVAPEGGAAWLPFREVLVAAENPPPQLPSVPLRSGERAESGTAKQVDIPFRGPVLTNFLQLVTFGIYSFYLVATFAEPISALTRRERLSFGTIILLCFLTLGVFPIIYLVILAFDIDRYSTARQTEGRRRDLGATVLTLTAISVIGAFATAGIAIVASLVAGVWSVWLVQAELNLYATTENDT